MMEIIVVVYAAFGLAASEGKTEIMCSRTKGMPEATTIFGVEAAGQVYNQTNELVYLEGSPTTIIMLTCRSNSIGAYATHAIIQLPEVHPRTVRPTERSPRAQNSYVKQRYSVNNNVVTLRRVEPARVLLRHAASNPYDFPDSLHRLAKEQSHRPPDLLSGHPYEDGK